MPPRDRSGPRRTAAPPPVGKTRITIRIDDDLLDWFRRDAGAAGGYQSLLNRALRDYVEREPLEATLRRVVREELARAGRRKSPHGYDDEEITQPRSLVADSGGMGSDYGAALKRGRRVRARRKRGRT